MLVHIFVFSLSVKNGLLTLVSLQVLFLLIDFIFKHFLPQIYLVEVECRIVGLSGREGKGMTIRLFPL